MNRDFPTASFRALGTTVTVVTTDADALAIALRVVITQIEALDAAVNRFRDDSELARLNRSSGRPVPVSGLLFEAIGDALRAAWLTGGLVAPTTGDTMVVAGDDRDFALVATGGLPLDYRLHPVPGWQRIHLDASTRVVEVPVGVHLDLGATAQAGCADRSAEAAAAATGRGVLVNLGGDVAVAGPAPIGGWPVRVAERYDAADDAPGVTVAISEGGMATSGRQARRWARGKRNRRPVGHRAAGPHTRGAWRTATVASSTCLEANIASTAAIILGPDAPDWLQHMGEHARLIGEDGRPVTVGDWPKDAMYTPDPLEVQMKSSVR